MMLGPLLLAKSFSEEFHYSKSSWLLIGNLTQFYLKDFAWADAEHYHLGPIVAAHQIHH